MVLDSQCSGERPTSGAKKPSFLVEEALGKPKLTDKDRIFLGQVILASRYRKSEGDPKKEALKEIEAIERKITDNPGIGLTLEDLRAINRWVTDLDCSAKLNENFLRRIQEKLAA